MFTLDRPTCVCNRLSAFQVVQGFSAPAGRWSSALMLRCTLASRGPNRSLHSSKRAVFTVVLMGLVHVIKLFRDLRHGTIPRSPWLAVSVPYDLPPLSWCLMGRFRRVRQTVGICRPQTSCDHSTGLIQCRVQLLCMVERSHTGQAYSAAE